MHLKAESNIDCDGRSVSQGFHQTNGKGSKVNVGINTYYKGKKQQFLISVMGVQGHEILTTYTGNQKYQLENFFPDSFKLMIQLDNSEN